MDIDWAQARADIDTALAHRRALRAQPSAMASGSTTPTSAGSYSDADVRRQGFRQAEVNKMKVAPLDELLRRKGVKPSSRLKAEKAIEVSWHYTKEEIAEWRAQQETLTPPALLSTPRPGQPTLDTYFKPK